jgi:prepilin-type processing-associated H-X9-DG protein
MNPGGEAVTSVTRDSSDEQMKHANSLNHGQEGQNVLYGDGHAEWMTTPFCGTDHDNIFTAAGPEIEGSGRGTAVVVASSSCHTDSILLPSTADLIATKLTPAEIEKLTRQIQGSYTTKMHGYTAVLTIGCVTLSAGVDSQ